MIVKALDDYEYLKQDYELVLFENSLLNKKIDYFEIQLRLKEKEVSTLYQKVDNQDIIIGSKDVIINRLDANISELRKKVLKYGVIGVTIGVVIGLIIGN